MKKLLLLFLMLGCFISMQAQVQKMLALTAAGTLSSTLTVDEQNTVTNLILTGNIDARDFRTMRDLMPMLAEIDLSGTTIVGYEGLEGTSKSGNTIYPSNTVPENAFESKPTLENIILPNSTEEISQRAFLYCRQLLSATLPSSLLKINDQAFGWCNSLSVITLPESLKYIGYQTFATTNLSTIYIPESVEYIGTVVFFQCSSLREINVSTLNEKYSSVEGVLFDKGITELIEYPRAKPGTEYTIPTGVLKISVRSFDGSGLSKINVPEGTLEIGFEAFANVRNLKEINIPSSVTKIQGGAFAYNNNLVAIYVDRTIPVTLYGNGVFDGINKSTCILYVPGGSSELYRNATEWKDFQNIIEYTTYVPDDNFEQALIDLGYDSGALDDNVPTAKISSVVLLNLANKNIADLTGIESFLKLEKLYLSENKLTALDVRKNTLLKVLHCQNSQLTSLDLTENIALTELAPNFNRLTKLDLSKNTKLIKVFCQSNQLTEINVSNCISLITLICGSNQLTNLNVSNNSALVYLACENNKIENLDLSNNFSLVNLTCNKNNLYKINLQNGNNANMVGTSKGLNATENPNLLCIQVDNPLLAATYNWQKDLIASYSSDCSPKTYVPDDNFEQALINLGYDSGPLDDYVPTTNISGVISLDVSNKGIYDLTGIQDFIALQQLNCSLNGLTTIDISKNINLQSFSFYSNHLTSLDVSNNNKLQQIYGNNNLISNLDLSKNPELNALDFGNNKLTNLDLSQNPLLSILNCSNNQISNIDLTYNTNLEQIAVGGNPISNLEISRNLNLKWFYVYSTNLEKIDCSDNKVLESIDCSKNSRLISLNLKNGNNSILKTVFAIENPLLSCIQVDDPSLSATYADWTIDAQAGYSNNCAVPVANAGIDQNVNAGASVVLDGSLSFDSYGDPLTYTWTAPAGIVLNMDDPARPTFVAPNVNRERSFSFNLVVSDGLVNSIADAINVTVKPINTAPILVLNSLTVKLDASGNYNLSLTDLKSLVAGTTDDNDSFKNLKIVAEPSYFSCANVGTPMNVKLTVTDSEGASSSGNSLIKVLDVTPPTFYSIPKNYSAVCLSGENYSLPDFSELYPAKEACSKVTYTQTPVTGTIYTNSTKEIINLKAEDEFGNATQLSISFTLAVRSKLKSADINFSNEICGTPVLEVYPNPFKDRVYFVLTSPKETNAILEIFSSNGTKLKTLFSGKIMENQKYNLEFAPKEMPSQILFYKLLLDNELTTGKLILDK